jgi:uncharacterized protein YybS (DUF2232 family)
MLKESTELASAAKIHELLVPFAYTRLDKIIEIAFTVAEEVGEAAEEQLQLMLRQISTLLNNGPRLAT